MAFPGTYNFNYYAGDTFEFFVYPKNSTGGVFDDLSNYTALFLVATSRGASASAAAIHSINNPLDAVASVQDGDHVTCTIKPAGGRKLTAPTYFYDLQIQNTSASSSSFGKVFTLLTGTISVTQDVAVT
jgi:hypothetical protein